MVHVIRAREVSKQYRRRKRWSGARGFLRSWFTAQTEAATAIANLSFEVRQEESVGLIGENGAGKSTTIKMLVGVLAPSAGEIQTLGLDPWSQRRELSLHIGAVFGQRTQLFWDIPVEETFRLLKAMYGVPDEVYRYSCNEAIDRLDLGALLKTPVRLLSLGQRMRCDLVAALLHAPKVAFLDEPTIGVDVLMKVRIREHLSALRKRFGTTILMTTHDLKDITASCERILVLDRGELIYDGAINGFSAAAGAERSVVVDLKSPASEQARVLIERELLAEGARLSRDSPQHWRISFNGPGVAPRIISMLLQHAEVSDLSLQGPDLEAMMASFYSDSRPAQ